MDAGEICPCAPSQVNRLEGSTREFCAARALSRLDVHPIRRGQELQGRKAGFGAGGSDGGG